jgi:hypothetical protein
MERVSTLVGILAVTVGGASVGGAAAPEASVRVTLGLEDQANQIWSSIPDSGEDSRVSRVGQTSPSCAQSALRQAKTLAGRAQAGRLAVRTLELGFRLPSTLVDAAARAGRIPPADLFARYVQSSSEGDFVARNGAPAAADADLRTFYRQLAHSRSDHVLQPAFDPGCGPGLVLYELRALPDEPGRLYLHMLVEGGCACRTPSVGGPELRRFRVLGQAELEPASSDNASDGVTLRWRAKAPRYFVLGSCRRCETSPSEGESRAASEPAAGACGASCAPLAESLTGWKNEARLAQTELADLTEKASALQSFVAKNEKALEQAQGAPRRPAGHIASLVEQIRSGREQLASLSRTLGDVKKHAAEIQRAADEALSSGNRCQAQCETRAKNQTAEKAKPASEAKAAGGGPGTGLIVAGGAVVAGGATAGVLALQGDDDNGGVVGSWQGTRTVNNGPLFANCTRVFNESWVVTQTGQSLFADVESIGQDCGTPTCPTGCALFPFPWDMSGSLEGSTARFVAYGGTTCVLNLRLSGDTLSGSMSPCTQNPGMTQEVVLRRRK